METLLNWLAEHKHSKAWLARQIGVSAPAVSQWRQVPADHLVVIRELTGIPAAELRPDLAEIFK